MTLLPALAPGVLAGFAAGTLVSAACLLMVIAWQRAGRQRADKPETSRQPARRLAIRWRRTARQRTERAGRAWPESATDPPWPPPADTDAQKPAPRNGGRHAAPAGWSMRLAGRRR